MCLRCSIKYIDTVSSVVWFHFNIDISKVYNSKSWRDDPVV